MEAQHSPAWPLEDGRRTDVSFFEADGLVFGIRKTDGVVLASRQPLGMRTLGRNFSERAVRSYDLLRSAHSSDLNRSRLTLMVAQRCNLACVYCYGGDGEYGRAGVFDPDQALHLIDRFISRPGPVTRTINYFGGEPLLQFKLVRELTARALQQSLTWGRKPTFTMTTNATLVTPTVSAWLARHRFGVMVSIDGDPGVHNATRPDHRGRASWNAVVRGARHLLRDLGAGSVTARATLVAGFPDVSAMVARLEHLGFRSVALSAVEPIAGGDVLALTSEDFRRLHEALEQQVRSRLQTNERGSWDPLKSALELLLSGRRRDRSCGVGNLSSAASTDGHLYPCHRYVGDTRFVIGKSSDGLVNPTLPGFVAFETSRRKSLQACASCFAQTFCAGGCPHIATQRMDRGLAPHDTQLCDFIREGLRQAVRVVAGMRVPPHDGEAVVIGPDYLRRPCSGSHFRSVLEHRGKNVRYGHVWSQREIDLMRFGFKAFFAPSRETRTGTSPHFALENMHWSTLGLVGCLISARVIRRLDDNELRILGVCAAAIARALDGAERGGADEHALLRRLAGDRVASLFRELAAETSGGTSRCAANTSVRALPSLAIARLRDDTLTEARIREFMSKISPIVALMEEYERLMSAPTDQQNPWYDLLTESFGSMMQEDPEHTLRHPLASDLAQAHLMMEMKRCDLQQSWQVKAAEEYSAWLVRRLKSSRRLPGPVQALA